MAAVYKSLSKTTATKAEKGSEIDGERNGSGNVRKNKQRVLILSSRGVTYRYCFTHVLLSSFPLSLLLFRWECVN